MMKSRFVSIVLGLIFSTVSGFAVNSLISYKAFKSAALDAVAGTESDEECQLRTQENRGGLVLSMHNGRKTVSFFVPKSAEIRKTGKESSDGSYSYDYKVKGQGVLSVTHMDDAYFHVTLKSFRNNQSAYCDIDF